MGGASALSQAPVNGPSQHGHGQRWMEPPYEGRSIRKHRCRTPKTNTTTGYIHVSERKLQKYVETVGPAYSDGLSLCQKSTLSTHFVDFMRWTVRYREMELVFGTVTVIWVSASVVAPIARPASHGDRTRRAGPWASERRSRLASCQWRGSVGRQGMRSAMDQGLSATMSWSCREAIAARGDVCSPCRSGVVL